MSIIHPTSVISPLAHVGEDVEIGPYAVIDEHAVIGDGCQIGPHAHIGSHTKLGKKVEVYYGANIDTPQDYTWRKGVVSETIIGDGATIREYVTIHRPPVEGAKTIIGSKCFLMAFSHIGHDAVLDEKVTLANHTVLSGHVRVERGAVLSGHVLVHQFCQIGTLAMVSPGMKLRQDVPPFCMAMEDGYVIGSNVVGLRRAGFSAELRGEIKRAVKTYFHKGLLSEAALAEIEASNPSPPVKHFVDFIRGSKRGVLPGRPKKSSADGDEMSEGSGEE